MALFFKLFALGIFLQCLQQQPLCWQTLNDGFSKMIDGSHGILIEIFLIAAQTFLLSYFRGCRLLDFFSVLKVCGSTMKWLSSWRRLFLLNVYNSMAMSFVTKVNFWRRERYRIWLDSFLYLS